MSSANFLLRRLLQLYVYQPSRIFSVNSTNLILYVYPFQGGGPPAVALANFFGEFYKDLILRRLLLSTLSRGVGPPPRFLPLAKLGPLRDPRWRLSSPQRRLLGFGFRVLGLGFRVLGLGSWVWGFRVWVLGL